MAKLQRAAFLALTVSLAPACMLSPVDGELVSSPSTTVRFEGYDYLANTRLNIEAYHPTLRSWELLTFTNTEPASNPQPFDGSDWFRFDTTRSVPSRYWTAGGKGGSFARVRTVRHSASGHLQSVIPDWYNCYQRVGSVGRFLTSCTSKISPDAYLYTFGYPRRLDLVVTNLHFSPLGTTVHIKNEGRPGRIKRIECFRFGGALSRTENRLIRPGETIQIRVGLAVSIGQRVTCTALGAEMDGTPEQVTCDEDTGTCGDNTRSERV